MEFVCYLGGVHASLRAILPPNTPVYKNTPCCVSAHINRQTIRIGSRPNRINAFVCPVSLMMFYQCRTVVHVYTSRQSAFVTTSRLTFWDWGLNGGGGGRIDLKLEENLFHIKHAMNWKDTIPYEVLSRN